MGFDQLVDRQPAKITRDPVTATVVTSDDSGVYVVPIDGDNRHPIGPCRGASRYALNEDGDLVTRPLSAGVVVLLVFTDAGPWVANSEGG